MTQQNKPILRFKSFSGDWEQRKLSTLMDFSNGINAPKENYGKGRKMISVMDILSKEPISYDNIRNSVEVDSKTESNNKVENGDIVFVRSSEVRNEVGWAKAYLENEFALYSGFTIRGKKIFDFDAFFVELSINGKNREQIESKAGGSTRFNVSQSILKSVVISEPSLVEQKKISAFFKQLDDTIALHQRKLELLKEQKTGFLQKMFPKNGSNVPEIRFSGFTEDWEQRKLGELGQIMTGTTPPTNDVDNYSEDGVIWVTPSDIIKNITTDTAKKLSPKGESAARVVPPGTILVTCIASIGKNTMVSTFASFNQQINSLTPNSENNSHFLLTQSEIWSQKMKQFASTGTMQIVNKSDFSKLEVNVTSLEEQTKIGIFFNNLDDTIALHQKQLEVLKETKKSLLQKMFV